MKSKKRPAGSFIQTMNVMLVVMVFVTFAHASITQAASPYDCTEDGGTMLCVGPIVWPWKYQVSDGATVAQGTNEAATIAKYQQLASVGTCTFSLTDGAPAWQPAGSPGVGSASAGNYMNAMYYAQGFYWAVGWKFGIVDFGDRIPLVVQGTFGRDCERQFGPGGAYVHRTRSVECPYGFRENVNTSRPDVSVCYTGNTGLRQEKNFGPCDSCKGPPVTFGNPGNAVTGNKYQREVDYQSSSTPLEFVRHYNSLLINYTGGPYTTNTLRSVIGLSWRHSYERVIRFGESPSMPTAYAFRSDGRMLLFKLQNGALVAEGDIDDRLVRLTDEAGQLIGFKYTMASSEDVETYDAAGKLIEIRTRAGVAQTLGYDGNDRLLSVTDSFGRSLSFGYDTNGRLTTMTDPAGGVYSYGYGAYDAINNVQSVTYPDQRSRTYLYNEQEHTGGYQHPYHITGILDEAGARFATYKYAPGYEWIGSTEHGASADKYQFGYGGGWPYFTATDPLGHQRTYNFTTVLGTAKITSISAPCGASCGNAASVTYDASGNIATKTDFKGHVTTYAYDLTRNLQTSRTEAYGTPRARTITTQWNPSYRLPTQMDEPGKRTTFTHDANGNVLTRTELDTATSTSRTWTYTYNSFGKVLTANGPRTDVTDVTTYTYYTCTPGYQCGQVHTITNAAGHITTYNTYNAHGQPLTMTDPNGMVTTLTYDLRQRLTSRTVGTEATTFEYWPTGLLKKATLPDASYLKYTYDPAHRLTEIEDSEGNRIVYTLDAMGNRTKEELFDPSSALTQTRSRVFDTLNRLQKEIGATGTANVTTTFGYDNNGNQTSVAAPLSRDTSQGYDELNRLTQVTDPLSGITHYGYNVLDQLISVTDPKGLATSYSYNVLGDLEQQTSPDTGVTVNTYDTGGNLKTSTDARGAVTTHAYDALNRVTGTAFTLGSTSDPTLTYTYDAGTYGKGRLTGASDSNHSLSWSYDDQGRLLTAGQTVGTVSKTTSYAYSNGQRQSMTTPSGQFITYSYTNGKVTSISVNGTVLASNILHDPFGPVRQWTWGNGTLSVRTFDQDGKITQMDSGGLKTYSYDDAFRITGITDTTNAALSWTYGYDDLDRLTSGSKTGTSLGYSYDANGNRLAQTGSSASTFTVAANSNRLSSTAGALARTYGYDNAGNTTSFTGISFTYNNRGRMKSSTKSGVTTNYTYNALGQLIKKGSNALYYYDDAGHILGIYNGSGALTEEIVWLGDIPIVTLRPKAGGGINIYNIHTDHLNTPRLVTGSVNPGARWRWDSDPFGVGTPNNNPTGAGAFEFNLRFAGQVYLAETGLNYNYFRDYDPGTGRYVQSDPIGLRGGINTYGYANGNPVSFTDPLGLDALPRPGIPLIIPPAFVPGTPEYNDLVDSGSQFLDDLLGPIMDMTARGNVADTQIKGDYEKYASAERLCGKEPKDRCTWLEENKSKYRAYQVKATQKAWGCRRSRASK